MTDYHIGVISHSRSQNVSNMEGVLSDKYSITWYVGKNEGVDYKKEGAKYVVESGKLCESRNRLLEDAFKMDKTCIQLSDDLVSLRIAEDKKNTRESNMEECISVIEQALNNTRMKLGGVNVAANAFYFDPLKPIKLRHFVLGDFSVIKPTDLRYDTRFKTKEDYDYTLQHIQKYGGVARCDSVIATFKHYNNIGGVVDSRTPEVEQKSIRLLKEKWGRNIVDNPRRPNEVLLRVKEGQ